MAEVPSDWDPLGQVVGGLSLVFPSSKIILEPAVSSPFLSWFRTLVFHSGFVLSTASQSPAFPRPVSHRPLQIISESCPFPA